MDNVPCDYLAVDWSGIPWVRFEECYRVDGKIYIGQRSEGRVPMTMDNGRCRDDDHKTYPRYRIGEREWICIRK
jgi:hypothetical protein